MSAFPTESLHPLRQAARQACRERSGADGNPPCFLAYPGPWNPCAECIKIAEETSNVDG